MLQQVLESIHNMFPYAYKQGEYTVVNGTLSLPFLQDGQRMRIVGSVFNDGVYTYHPDGIRNDDDTAEAGLQDETFAGTICALAVPPAVIALSGEINAWVAENGDAINSPYSSESVLGVYSYTKASGTGAGGSLSWQDVFKTRLNQYRRICP